MAPEVGAKDQDRLLFAGLRAPSEILFGSGQRGALPRIVKQLGSRAFICADPFVAESSELGVLLRELSEAGVSTAVFSEVIPELPVGSIATAFEAAQEHGCDVVVAVGGGSSIDLAKLVSCLRVHGGRPEQFYGEFAVPGPVLPIVAVPTTAGTGSEVTPVAVLTDTERNLKVGVASPHLIPRVAVCDPELTLTCPPAVTSASGTDALSHCIESYTAVRRQLDAELMGQRVFVGKGQLTDDLALSGIRSIAAGLLRAYEEPEDLAAREQVMYGSLLGGLAFGTAGNAAAHALQYPIGAETKTPHGVGIGLLLPYVMEYNRAERVSEYAKIARIFGAAENSAQALAEQAPVLVQDHLRKVGIPTTLAEIGFDAARIEWAAQQGIKAARLSENNPVPLTAAGAERILRAAGQGEVSLVNAREGAPV